MIQFKTSELRSQWNSGKLHPRLQVVILATAAFMLERFNIYMVITSIFRDSKPSSVHAHWRGVDIRVSYFKDDGAQVTADWINNSFAYDLGSEKLTAFYGDDDHKDHIHLQTSHLDSRWQV